VQQFLMSGEAPPPMPSRISAWSVYDVFTLAGGEQLFVAATSDRQFRTLCELLGRQDLADDPAYATNAARVALRPQLLAALGATFATRDKAGLAARLESAGLPYAPITRPDQLVDDPHLRASGALAPMTTEDGGVTQVLLLPLTMGGRRPGVRLPLPKAGEHTAEILARLRKES
jgi:crotonobetainyl-CoA:carnitine CoA-transferase CaiB-like acyl-CoA transferase